MRVCTVSLLLLSFAIAIVLPLPTNAQKPEVNEQEPERIVVGTNEVVLDAVVKDKKGRPVKDLTAADFQISEDGVPQEVRSFRLVTRESAQANEPKENIEPSDPAAKNKQAENMKTPENVRRPTPP